MEATTKPQQQEEALEPVVVVPDVLEVSNKTQQLLKKAEQAKQKAREKEEWSRCRC